MNFQRGSDPKESIGLGIASQIDIYIGSIIQLPRDIMGLEKLERDLFERFRIEINLLAIQENFDSSIVHEYYYRDWYLEVKAPSIGYNKKFIISS